jgi:integrase
MRANTSKALNDLVDKKKGTQRVHQNAADDLGESSVVPFPSAQKHHEIRDKRDKTARLAKTSVDYWKAKVRPRILKDGTETPELYLRIKEAGRTAWLPLHTANRNEAARKARDLWQGVQANGLPAVLAELKPDARPARVCTVGEYLEAARPFASVRPRVFDQYAAALRRVFALVLDLQGPAERFFAKGEAAAAWRAKLDGLSLDAINPETVEAWRLAYINAAPDHTKRAARAVSVSTYLRNAKGAFARKILARVSPAKGEAAVCLPPVLPLAGLTAPAGTKRFVPEVKSLDLYTAARADFAKDPETLTAALLLLTGGLRRGEADLLEWANVNLAEGRISITTTEFFTPKTKESDRVVKLPPDVAEHLRARRKAHPRARFVLDGTEPNTTAKGYTYRAAAWATLTTWLRSKGVTDPKALHSLRKHAGSLVHVAGGLESARRFLGHKKITTTAESYLDADDITADPTATPAK